MFAGVICLMVVFGIVGAAALLEMLTEKVPAFGRLIEWLVDKTMFTSSEDYEEER